MDYLDWTRRVAMALIPVSAIAGGAGAVAAVLYLKGRRDPLILLGLICLPCGTGSLITNLLYRSAIGAVLVQQAPAPVVAGHSLETTVLLPAHVVIGAWPLVILGSMVIPIAFALGGRPARSHALTPVRRLF